MAKGLCCQAQARGVLGAPLLINVRLKSGVQVQRCGVCEIAPSCQNPQKPVFRFRFLKGQDCNLTSGRCIPTPTGVAQYQSLGTSPNLATLGTWTGPGGGPVNVAGADFGVGVAGSQRVIGFPQQYQLPAP
jgi:hypothetical protein